MKMTGMMMMTGFNLMNKEQVFFSLHQEKFYIELRYIFLLRGEEK